MGNTKFNLKQTALLIASQPLILFYSFLIAVFIYDAFSGIYENATYQIIRNAFLVFLLMIGVYGEYEKYEFSHKSSDNK